MCSQQCLRGHISYNRISRSGYQWPYQAPEASHQAVETEVTHMLQIGILEECPSPWSSPIVTVPKAYKSLRCCYNFRKLNKVSEFNNRPLLQVDNLTEQLWRAYFISTLDLTKGFWQVTLTPITKAKTAFSTSHGHWQYHLLWWGQAYIPSSQGNKHLSPDCCSGAEETAILACSSMTVIQHHCFRLPAATWQRGRAF